ncbi:cadherin EGF LAG seven-pass G-type receptor 1-like [Paramacrobiotus metropolitanus]|uniref:cadherin EGF LAG seven-pass G-type receptor 1-like n=1 Tax=Paramacrobiotus metropolitanus TaxID=2943436 RepID=UPI002445ECFC|nr:cadherin EGF LAG seven-pass G-type receptor 1-like [Paramacrobiotus metropolitanus]XP_055347667.1 cadherin EGF LAG seven-pass G-type receptor 1-like [Paramacrobiotus metropolitanus]
MLNALLAIMEHSGNLGLCLLLVVLCLLGVSKAAKVELSHLNDKNSSSICDDRYYRQPSCEDGANGYQCVCNPGFEYNSQGMCIAVATNSRLEFSGGAKKEYAVLVGKPARAMDGFTIAFFLRVRKKASNGYIVSYSVKEHPNIFYLKIMPNFHLVINMYNETENAYSVLRDGDENQWRHIALTWESKGGSWILYVEGNGIRRGQHFGSGLLLPANGETTLGARSQHYRGRDKTLSDEKLREKEQIDAQPSNLQIDISHFNIWSAVLPNKEIRAVQKDCHLRYCGSAVRWTDFRDGTRGALKLKWPSGVHNKKCFGEWIDDEVTCDRFCSAIKGARCRAEMVENIEWPKTNITRKVEVECPGKKPEEARKATRQCHITSAQGTKGGGKWDPPSIDACLSVETRRHLKDAEDLSRDKAAQYEKVFPIIRKLVEVSKPSVGQSPNDISAYIKVTEFLLEFQEDRIRNRNWLVDRWQSDQGTKLYPNATDVKLFMNQIMDVFNNLLPDQDNREAWNMTRPFGQSIIHLLHIIVRFVDIHAGVLLRDVVVERSQPVTANFSRVMQKLAINMEVHFTNHTTTLRYPRDDQAHLPLFQGFSETKAIIRKSVWAGTNERKSSLSNKRAFVVTTVFVANVREFLPNPAYATKNNSKLEDNLNSALYLIRFFPEDPVPLDYRYIVTTFSFLSTHNISDAQCFHLQYEKIRKGFVWKFSKQDCVRPHKTLSRAMCTCNNSGHFYGVTTDMYDPAWSEEKIVIYFMNWATYFGCAMSALCSLLGFCILVFLRTTSNTSTLHKNTALAVGFAQLSLMCGIDLHEFPPHCKVFTIATLYFILCLFCWMMNQAFHIYSVVTYSVHNNDEVEDGSVVKFMIMGWVVPIVPVLIGAATKGEKFFHKGACFVSWDWFLVVGGPGVGIIFVTLLMKVIALKEYMQSSYSLSEKGNKLVVNYMKAGRSQWGTVLAMYCCLLVALKMQSTVLKFLFAIFSILQGSSLLCFSVLMNDEVRNILQNNFEGSKDKEEHDIIDELAELTHSQTGHGHHGHGHGHGHHYTHHGPRMSRQKSLEKDREHPAEHGKSLLGHKTHSPVCSITTAPSRRESSNAEIHKSAAPSTFSRPSANWPVD